MTMLTLEDVNAFYGKSHVLHDVSISVDEGQLVAILGRNGAGKTTTLRSIMGMVDVRSGQIMFEGDRIDGLSSDVVSGRGIALIPENRRVFGSLSVEENLRMGHLGHQHGAFEQKRDEVTEYFPRLDERLDQRAGLLSGGEQQMLVIARALMAEPDLLLVDEPTEGLMPTLVDRLQEILVEINEAGLTMLLVEQDTDFALGVSDHGYIIEEGRIALDRPSEELLDPEIRNEYLALG